MLRIRMRTFTCKPPLELYSPAPCAYRVWRSCGDLNYRTYKYFCYKSATMPKNKKQDSSDSDSGPEDRNPPSKKSKQTSQKSSSNNDDEDDSWSIGKNRFVKLREFKGRFFVDIREFYNADGELKPGKKGISLTLEQWNSIKNCVPDVDAAIKRKC